MNNALKALGRRRRFSSSQVERILDEYERSDMSGSAFAREQGLCYSVFCRWRRQREARSGRGTVPQLQALPLGSLLGASWSAEIVWPQGPTLRLQQGASVAWASELIEALRRPC